MSRQWDQRGSCGGEWISLESILVSGGKKSCMGTSHLMNVLLFFFFDFLGNAKAFQASLICLYCGRKLWNLKAPAFAPVCLCKSCSSEVPHCSVLPHLSGRENKLCLPGLLCASYCLPSVSPANHASIRSQLATHVPVAMCLSLPLFYISWYDSCLINSFIIIVILDSQHLI